MAAHWRGTSCGHVLASGDFNGDGYDDGVIQSRKTITVGTQQLVAAGAVTVLYGSAQGLHVNNQPRPGSSPSTT